MDIKKLTEQELRRRILALLNESSGVIDYADVRAKLKIRSRTLLNYHADRLEEAGLVRVERKFCGRMPVTTLRLARPDARRGTNPEPEEVHV
ncbi:transcriptional regulator [Bradyrhizobium sp. GCM10027634]|uniref:transcriptional regulator n=1 Tax=unclassified Bradyrhizobium TaxID=2631580 RepID=UPI00188BF76F|nr:MULTISPECIES: transcriptional regulator [unclassified Bradyrhizobium]MDN5003909.1 helix-turn-helix domain-containing protein [Bradyrhizobium sp. WYCCWR 12677]QOZ45430.1 hypothetical protein XH89_19530 [Bradyrhizobium sp. CCBAU 53340]